MEKNEPPRLIIIGGIFYLLVLRKRYSEIGFLSGGEETRFLGEFILR
jgi:hypothetical protein